MKIIPVRHHWDYNKIFYWIVVADDQPGLFAECWETETSATYVFYTDKDANAVALQAYDAYCLNARHWRPYWCGPIESCNAYIAARGPRLTRLQHIQSAILYYQECIDKPEPRAMLADLLTDIMHWCDQQGEGTSFAIALREAHSAYATHTETDLSSYTHHM